MIDYEVTNDKARKKRFECNNKHTQKLRQSNTHKVNENKKNKNNRKKEKKMLKKKKKKKK